MCSQQSVASLRVRRRVNASFPSTGTPAHDIRVRKKRGTPAGGRRRNEPARGVARVAPIFLAIGVGVNRPIARPRCGAGVFRGW